jgi:lipopolysaccharide biosynthesis protein
LRSFSGFVKQQFTNRARKFTGISPTNLLPDTRLDSQVKLICFYLPQYHPIPENDAWWGPGYTEWTGVVQAKPAFPGHQQPRLPSQLGFYDLRLAEVREAQAELARAHGVHGFCYHHYWFHGRRLLERPFNDVLASGKPDFPFCLSWANESWTRRWDGSDERVLIEQRHSIEDDTAFIEALIPAFRDHRYIRIRGKPVLLVYRTDILADPKRTSEIWRTQARKAGLDDLYLIRVETFTPYGIYQNPIEIGFDAAVEFPPHAVRAPNITGSVIAPQTPFHGQVLDYRSLVLNWLRRPEPPFPLFRGLFPSWDNTARKGHRALIFLGSTPALYRGWLSACINWTALHRAADERLVFVNAWNEWGEGCQLEPDTIFQDQYLAATRDALNDGLALFSRIEQAVPSIDATRATGQDLLRTVFDITAALLQETLQLKLTESEMHDRIRYLEALLD